MTQNILIFGAGKQAQAMADLVAAHPDFELAGFVDSVRSKGEAVAGHSVLGGEEELEAICEQAGTSQIAISIGDNYRRQQVYGRLKKSNPGLQFPNLVHPTAYVSESAQIAEAVLVMPGVHVIGGARVDTACLLNTASVVEHDCHLQAGSSLGPAATLAGNVIVGERSFVGARSVVIQDICIGDDVVIGAGSVVRSDIQPLTVAYGNPAREQRKRTADEAYL